MKALLIDKRDWPLLVAASALLALCLTSLLFGGCLYIRPTAPPRTDPCTAIPLLPAPDEPARVLPEHPSPDMAFKAATATIHNLEEAFKDQQELVRQHNAALGR